MASLESLKENESYFSECKLICEVMCSEYERMQKVFKITCFKGIVKSTE